VLIKGPVAIAGKYLFCEEIKERIVPDKRLQTTIYAISEMRIAQRG